MEGLKVIGYDYLYKIVVVGDSGVGKSHLISRFSRDNFDMNQKSTIGVDFCSVDIPIDNKIIKIQIWDTAGQERYQSLTTAYYRGSVGVMIVYDVTNRSTFDNIKKWYYQAINYTHDNIKILLVGNKSDLANQRSVLTIDAKDIAEKNNMLFIEVSALNSENINECFMLLLNEIYKDKILKDEQEIQVNKNIDDAPNEIINIDNNKSTKRKNCNC